MSDEFESKVNAELRDEEAERIYREMELAANPPLEGEIRPAAVRLVQQSSDLMKEVGLFPGPPARAPDRGVVCVQLEVNGPTVYLIPTHKGVIVTTKPGEEVLPLPLHYDRKTESMVGPRRDDGTRRGALAIVAEAVRDQALGTTKRRGIIVPD